MTELADDFEIFDGKKRKHNIDDKVGLFKKWLSIVIGGGSLLSICYSFLLALSFALKNKLPFAYLLDIQAAFTWIGILSLLTIILLAIFASLPVFLLHAFECDIKLSPGPVSAWLTLVSCFVFLVCIYYLAWYIGWSISTSDFFLLVTGVLLAEIFLAVRKAKGESFLTQLALVASLYFNRMLIFCVCIFSLVYTLQFTVGKNLDWFTIILNSIIFIALLSVYIFFNGVRYSEREMNLIPPFINVLFLSVFGFLLILESGQLFSRSGIGQFKAVIYLDDSFLNSRKVTPNNELVCINQSSDTDLGGICKLPVYVVYNGPEYVVAEMTGLGRYTIPTHYVDGLSPCEFTADGECKRK